ncbi:MAG TPA: adenylate/guanylate cyclase domain-containing protein, partial [Longimicrobiales bacterium]|nr:adenylate/guanylate cyclase domain-containing protein [Longimicrobiales bacterium]
MSASTSGRIRGRRRPLTRLLHGLAVGTSASLLLLGLARTPAMRLLEARTYDLRMRWAADPAEADTGIVVVDIDAASLEVYRDRLGRWPWPRDVHAALLQYLGAAGARLVVFDVLFPEADVRDPASDSAFAEALETTDLAVLPLQFWRAREEDAARWYRLRAAERTPGQDPEDILRPFSLRSERPPEERPAASSAGSETSSRPPASPPGASAAAAPEETFPVVETPHPLFAGRARALGSVNLNADDDGVVRGDRLVYSHEGLLLPSLALAAAREVAPERFGGEAALQGDILRLGAERIPLDGGRMLLRWRGPWLEEGRTTYRVYPAFHVLNSFEQVLAGREPDVPMEALKDKIVFVGVTGSGTSEFDARPTPLRAFDPGVMIHVTELDDLLAGDWMRRAPRGASTAVVLLTGVGVGVLAAGLVSPWLAATGALLLLGLVTAGVTAAFAGGLWLDLAAPLAAGGLSLAGALTLNWATEGREKRRVRELFGRYVSPAYVRRLADDHESVRLGGERVPLTMLFSDIRGFTSISERLPAEEVIGLLNEYLERMTDVVFRHGGTLDKFIGDAVMAFWGAPVPEPEHARRAVEAGLEMLQEVDALNRRWKERGVPVDLRIG